MGTILPILPTNLRHLCLEPDGSLLRQTVSMAAFALYTLLESLVIAANDGVTYNETSQGSFILDSALPTLQNLTLDPWPFHVHKDQSLVQCLPRVQNLAVHVLSSKAQTMLALSSLKHLTLILHDSFEPLGLHVPQLQVPHASQLQQLFLAGPPRTPFCLDLTDQPAHLAVAHVAAGRIRNHLSVGHSQYSPPEKFNDLGWYLQDGGVWWDD